MGKLLDFRSGLVTELVSAGISLEVARSVVYSLRSTKIGQEEAEKVRRDLFRRLEEAKSHVTFLGKSF